MTTTHAVQERPKHPLEPTPFQVSSGGVGIPHFGAAVKTGNLGSVPSQSKASGGPRDYRATNVFVAGFTAAPCSNRIQSFESIPPAALIVARAFSSDWHTVVARARADAISPVDIRVRSGETKPALAEISDKGQQDRAARQLAEKNFADDLFGIIAGTDNYCRAPATRTERAAYNAYYFRRNRDPSPVTEPVRAREKGIEKRTKDRIEQELGSILYSAKDETFEDGMESEFSEKFTQFIKQHKKFALDALQKCIESQAINLEVLSEALRWLPRIEDTDTYEQRLNVIKRCLFLRSARVRDAAVLALWSLGDSSGIKPLREAIEKEEIDELRADMLQALTYLEAASGVTSS